LSRTDQVHVFVFGHEPAYPQPDVDNGRARHMRISLNAYPTHRDRFWTLLIDEGVVAYFCGHTHNYSAVNVDGVWQVDAGHARGLGDPDAPSTFVMVHVDGPTVTFDAYRDAHDGAYDYDDIRYHGTLAPLAHRSFQDGVAPTVSYAGTRDTYIDASSPDTNYGGSGVTTLASDGDPDQAAMLRWDISSISPGTTVQAASITLSVTSPSSDTYELYEVKRDWVETEATWNHYAIGNPWQQPGAQAASDKGEDVLGVISASSAGTCVINLNDDGIARVQRWVDDPFTNYGVVIADYGEDDGVRFDSRHASTVISRPKLTALFSVSPGSATIAGTTAGFVHAGHTLTVTVSPVTASLPISYLWQATDQAPVTHAGHTSLIDTQAFTWTMGGPKAVTVTVTNAGGTTTATHAITIYTPVQAAFVASPISGVGPLTVAFTNTSNGDYTSSLWDFGDGVNSTLRSPTHTYPAAAVYTVTLHVSGPGGRDTETKAAYITVREQHSVYLPLIGRGRWGTSGARIATSLTPRAVLPLVAQSPSCSLSLEEQQLALYMIQHPDQQRPSLACHPILARVARERAEDMARRRYFGHTNPDGFGPNYLVRQAGYVLPSYYGTEPDANNIESIAGGYPTADATWQGWMGSSGHRDHLLGLNAFWAEQIEYGVGYAYDATSPYRHYWVVITAKPGP